MMDLLWLVPALPFLGFLVLALAGKRMPVPLVAAVGSGSVGLSALLTLVIGIDFLGGPASGSSAGGAPAFTQTLWTWMRAGNFSPAIAFRLDALSLVMMFVVTFVGFLIHLYSTEFMEGDDGYSRFFAWMNLFVGSMLTLVLADNLLLLYLGWEGVGMCSYLLIGFWYREPANSHAAIKAFVVTRVGDTAMSVGLFVLVMGFGTLDIQSILAQAPDHWKPGAGAALAVCLLLLGGAVGKSAQLPLQVWLPDAMAGPTPTSALIHAATMVTAGVYLIARMHVLFDLAPAARTVVGIVGAATLLVAGFSALTQRDIKRVLAYSTVSQIGYMFLALGAGAYAAAMFHFMTHAFFKALLFLGAGVVIEAMHHEHDMFKMGGLKGALPVTFWTFLAGSASLAAFPLVTAGFYSKDLILAETGSSPTGGAWLWTAGAAGALLTAVYTFRMVFVTFYGEQQSPPAKLPRVRMTAPLVVLAFLSLVGGFVETPLAFGNISAFSRFIGPVFSPPAAPPGGAEGAGPAGAEPAGLPTALFVQLAPGLLVLAGIGIAYYFYRKRFSLLESLTARTPVAALRRFWASGWGFDRLYDRLFVRPYIGIAVANRRDVVDALYTGVALVAQGFYFLLRKTQNGRVRRYAAGIAAGAIVVIALVIFL